MKIKYLGTAAAEAIPALFCRCDLCTHAMKLGGKEIRRRSNMLINGHVMVDFSPDIYMQKIDFGLDLADIDTLIITHSHLDHLAANELTFRDQRYYCYLKDSKPLKVYANKKSCLSINEAFDKEFGNPVNEYVNVNTIKPFDCFTVDELTVYALPAVHDTREDCLFYLIIESLPDGSKNSLLYTNDTALPPDSTLEKIPEFLGDSRLSIVSMDCTNGLFDGESTVHMRAIDNIILKNKLLFLGCADSNTKFIATHFSHNGRSSHSQLVEEFKKSNIDVAFDGKEVCI